MKSPFAPVNVPAIASPGAPSIASRVFVNGIVSRRRFLGSAGALLVVTSSGKVLRAADADAGNPGKVKVGAHPWVYAATQPKNDITPILPQIFADMQYAGLDGIELMHTALLPDDAVARIGELSQKHKLPVIA